MTRIRHLVMFRVPEQRNLAEVESILEGFDRFAGVLSVRVERDLGFHPPAWDLLLVTEHADADALWEFRADPAHKAAALILSELSDARATIDHKVQD